VPLVADHSIATVIGQARALGRRSLLEPDGYAVAAELGIATPAHVIVHSPGAVSDELLSALPGSQVVVKALSHELPHRSSYGGVRVAQGTTDAVTAALTGIADALAGVTIDGFLIAEHIEHSQQPGAQLLLGFRRTPDLGPIVTLGPGGALAELLSASFDRGRGASVFAPGLHTPNGVGLRLRGKTVGALAEHPPGSMESSLTLDAMTALAVSLLAFVETEEAREIEELEFNPIVGRPAGPVALDALVRLTSPDAHTVPIAPQRPVHKIDRLLRPQSVAVIGVSRTSNPGRVIVENMLRSGFPATRMAIVKPGEQEIAGVRCYPSIEALPNPVDLCVVSLAAADVSPAIDALVRNARAESIIVVSGGLGERAGTDALEAEIQATLAASRHTASQGPVLNGANCLGVRSVPGGFDATFIPQYKRPVSPLDSSSLAIVAQSGAFMVARASKLVGLNPRYLISVGNQLDLTVGDYMTYLKDDTTVRTVACYIEGFRAGDGLAWLRAAADLVDDGRDVIVYRAGRTTAGIEATVSHTAAVAGDYAAFRELAESFGVLVADSLEDFDDLVHLHCCLADKDVDGMRLGAVSNAGFECVAAADQVGMFTLSHFSSATQERLGTILDEAGLAGVVAPGNPVDVTPILHDEPFAAALQVVLDDSAVDVAVVGCVPLTPALQTLPPGPAHTEDLSAATSVATRLIQLHRASRKAWVVTVDAGPLYDPLVEYLLASGVPVFRTIDRALTVFARYCAHRCRDRAIRSFEPTRPFGEHDA
jgi:acyl-CoA synthetase (NDP forming)